ncbi:hypothetical protein, conserved [Eimeria maxima]|uniref:Uncharacterized protein n=1 Tax=Eimeria maxima TaxID=5804 RepID=U6MJQ7_EIMMA|nr:hypothetical protein, conserved [Eimeria maxima]CDJ61885.1 hypothetical protein, conserved [Eimeria maxima]
MHRMAHSATTDDEPSLHLTITIPTAEFCHGVMMSRLIKRLMMQHRLLDANERHARTAIIKRSGLESAAAAAAAAQQQKEQQTEQLQQEISKHLNTNNLVALCEEHGKELAIMQRSQYNDAQEVPAQAPLRWQSIIRLQDGVFFAVSRCL